MSSLRLGVLLIVCIAFTGFASACGSKDYSSGFGVLPAHGTSPGDGDAAFFGFPFGDASVGSSGGPGLIVGSDATVGDALAGPGGTLTLAPADQTIDVIYGQQMPTITYTAIASGGQLVHASFAIDRGEIGTVAAASGVMSPTGKVGGTAVVSASYNGRTGSTHVTVNLHLTDVGAPGVAQDAGGAGGVGGVGGEGPGGPVDVPTQGVLQGQPMADTGLSWIYPYDKTVWPRALLAPLLQWNAPRAYDAVYINLKEKAFEYRGFFAKTATPFVRHPIPQAAWDALSYSNQGEGVSVTLVFTAGGQAYGPLTETWKIGNGALKGTVYYNSYGTNLAHNYCCTIGNQPFGGATLAIKHGAVDPVLVAGNDTDCRVCHSVSADGSRLVTQGTPNANSYTYDLKLGTQTPLAPTDGRFAWGALYPDGSFLLSDAATMQGAGWAADAQLFSLPSGTSLPSTGIPVGLRAGTPMFSPDGKHVAFNYLAGPNGDTKSLAAMDYDPATSTFSNLRILYTPPAGMAAWPSFLPTNDAVVFELETLSNMRDWGGTRSTCDGAGACSNVGTQAELWWIDLATMMPVRLDNLNGKGYLPTLTATQHTDDSVLNYEPTVNPVPSGGYSWVVFTSRRLYGNVATINPYWSDPRSHDITLTPTPKKLWVAAVDLNAAPGTDPSHPAFYLPAQELFAGNSRGYWVVDACQPSGTSCQTGDECCGGYCRNVDGGFACSDQPPACANEFDKCITSVDCCGAAQGLKCIGGRCAQPTPQ